MLRKGKKIEKWNEWTWLPDGLKKDDSARHLRKMHGGQLKLNNILIYCFASSVPLCMCTIPMILNMHSTCSLTVRCHSSLLTHGSIHMLTWLPWLFTGLRVTPRLWVFWQMVWICYSQRQITITLQSIHINIPAILKGYQGTMLKRQIYLSCSIRDPQAKQTVLQV